MYNIEHHKRVMYINICNKKHLNFRANWTPNTNLTVYKSQVLINTYFKIASLKILNTQLSLIRSFKT